MNLIRNAIRTPDGTVLVSYSRHDCKAHKDTITGEEYMIDGGLSYVRTSLNSAGVSMCLHDDQPHCVQREVLKWGTYGPKGDQPLQRKPISEMDSGHLKAVLEECRPSYVFKNCMEEELRQRENGDV